MRGHGGDGGILALLIAWMVGAALAGTGIETGAQGGLVVTGETLPTGPALLSAGGTLAPRLGVWFGRYSGIELDLPLSFLPEKGGQFRVVGPHLTYLVGPAPGPSILRPLFRVGVGVESRRWRTLPIDLDVAPYNQWVFEAHAGVALDIRALGALHFRAQVDGTLAVAQVDGKTAPVPGLMATFGFGARFDIIEDRDKDLIPNKQDACPDDTEDEDGWQDEDGCPDPDNDMDGVPDTLDGCDSDPEDLDDVEDYDGCPE